MADSTCSVSKPVGAIADLTTSTSGEVDSYSGIYNDYPPSAVFDDVLPLNDSTKYNRALIPSANGSSDTSQTSHRWVVYKFETATVVNAIGIYPYNYWGKADRAPKNWVFEAKDENDETWTPLDTRADETSWTSAYRYFKFDNDTPYQYYRFYCSSINGAQAYLELGEIEFYNIIRSLDTKLFQKKLEFTVAGHTGNENLKHLPVLVRLSTAIRGFHYDDCGTDGAGIRFADTNGNLLHHEIDTWNENGESCVWVELPHCRSNEKFTLYLAPEDESALPVVAATEVWDGGGNGGVPAVWHMNTLKADSSGHSYTYYNLGTIGSISTGGAVGSKYDGILGGGWSIAANGAWSGYGEGGRVTFSAWIARDAANANNCGVLSIGNVKLQATSTADSYTWKLYNSSTEMLSATVQTDITKWSHVAIVAGSGSMKLYFNGEIAATYTGDIPAPGGFRVGVSDSSGNNGWKSYIDEVRIHRAEESAEYVRASYATVASSNFLSQDGVKSVKAVGTIIIIR